MSLTNAINTATNGLNVIEKKISVTSNNISNADRPDYSRQTYTPIYFSDSDQTFAVGGNITGALDAFLAKSAVNQHTDYSYTNTLATYLKSYVDSLGTPGDTGESSSLSSYFDDFQSSLSQLGSDASNSASKNVVVTSAINLSAELNRVSSGIQTQRLQASTDIGNTVTSINNALDTLYQLNKQIAASDGGSATSNLQDERNAQLQTLGDQIGITYYIDSYNQLQVFTSSGTQILGNTVSHFSYAGVANISSNSTYPGGGIPGIMYNGVDVTSSLTTGQLGALIQLRDKTLPDEQSKMDALTNSLKDTVNTITNQGASLPPRPTLTGSTTVAGTDAFSATGTVRVAVTDANGIVQNYTDVDLSSFSTVSDVLSALNNISGISASIDSDGHLNIAATGSGMGVSVNEMDSSVGGKGFSNYFGLNNLFDGTQGALDIHVSDYLQQSASYFPSGALSNSPTLANGDNGIAIGDGSVATNVLNAIKGVVSFSSAGNFSAQNNTLSQYISSIISDAATRSNTQTNSASTSKLLLDTINSNISSATGVNLDEETANSAILSNSYNATAHIISIANDMFKTLLNAIQ